MPIEIPPIRFAHARGARLAYQDFGNGPPTVVSIPPTAQNIEVAWEREEIRWMLERFASFARFIHFDKRGTGCSDRRSRVNGIDERIDDLRAVMDDAGVERAHLFAASEGGPMAILFAVTFPNRVQSLTLLGSGASMLPPDMTDEERRDLEERNERYVQVWGTPDSPVVDGFAPSLAADQGFRTWHQRYERLAASTESLRELLELSLDMDVREVLADVSVPTLVIHRLGDRIVPIERGREIADRIPGAILFEQDGSDHFGYAGDVNGWMDEMERFITGSVNTTPRPAAGSVRIITLGRFAVERDGEELPLSDWGSRLARQLCKRLVVARGWPVTRDELMDLLWPDETDRRKLGARLSVQLSAVRRMLDGGIVANRDSIRLDLDAIDTDLEAFYRATDDGAIVAAYDGEFLPEDVYEDWAQPLRDAVRARFVSAARRQARRHLDRGAHLHAAALTRRLIDIDEFDEDAHRTLVVALSRAGEVGEARVAHSAWRAAVAELGVAPPELEDLI